MRLARASGKQAVGLLVDAVTVARLLAQRLGRRFATICAFSELGISLFAEM